LIPGIGIFGKISAMAKNTSILLGEHFENFVNEKISTGKFSSVSEVIRHYRKRVCSKPPCGWDGR
jgi:antitoxin ParD1/3/4